MLDMFLLLTPLFLLPVIALIAFAGCSFQPAAAGVTHIETEVTTNPPGTNSITANLTKISGGELIVAALQWRAAVATDKPSFSAGLVPLLGGGPFQWNNMQIQIFVGSNPDDSSQLTVTATLPHNSALEWNLCVSAYSQASLDSPANNPTTSVLNFTGSTPQTQSALTIGGTDLAYAVAFAADPDGSFPGTHNAFTPPTGFTAESQTTNPMVEDGKGANPFIVQATNLNPAPNAKGFIFAMGVNVS
jgi:hypothetical protein